MFELQTRSLASQAFRYEQWQFASARLNQDPSLVVRLDFENLSDLVCTLHNAAEKISSVPDATIVGCQRAEGRGERSRLWNSKDDQSLLRRCASAGWKPGAATQPDAPADCHVFARAPRDMRGH
jgi:hypothetical protein